MNTYIDDPTRGLSKLQQEILEWIYESGTSIEELCTGSNEDADGWRTEAYWWKDGAAVNSEAVWVITYPYKRPHFGYDTQPSKRNTWYTTPDIRSPKERAAVSRSIKRLIQRGLMTRISGGYFYNEHLALTQIGLGLVKR